MSTTTIEHDNLKMTDEGTTTTANTGIVSLLPLIAASSIGMTATTLDLEDYSVERADIISKLEVDNMPSEKLFISEGVEISGTSFHNIFQDSHGKAANYSSMEEFEILEGLVGDMLENSEQQPGELKSLMYDNIDDLLI